MEQRSYRHGQPKVARLTASVIEFQYITQSFRFASVHPEDHIWNAMKRSNSFYEVDVLEEISRRLGPPISGSLAIDAGAFLGTHSVYFVRICGVSRVIAYEPDPETFDTLQENVHLNGVQDRVVCFNKALGAKPGFAALVRQGPSNTGSNRVQYGLEKGATRVEVVKLDEELMAAEGNCVQLIKIDVEGFEIQVVKGARQLIRRHHPLLCIEVHSTHHLVHLLRLMWAEGYGIVDCLGFSPTYILEISISPVYRRLVASVLWVVRSLIPNNLASLRWYLYKVAKAVHRH